MQEKIRQFKKSRSGYVSTLTELINKLTEHINLNSDIDCIKQYEIKLQNAIKNIRDITTKLHQVVKDKNEIQSLLNFCTEQKLRLIQMKSLNEHTLNVTTGTLGNDLNKTKVSKNSNSHKIHSTHSAHSFKSSPIPSQFVHDNEHCNRENSSLCKPFPLRKSLNSHGSSLSRSSKNLSQSSSRSSHEKSRFENAIYLTFLERRRTADHALIFVKKPEERTEIKLELLQKSFECEREKKFERVSRG